MKDKNKVSQIIGLIKMGILVIFLIIILVMMIYYGREQINQIENYKETLPEYNLLKPNKFINLTDCNSFDLWIRFNESGQCLQGLPHENLSQIDSIQNYCNQDILVGCFK